MKSWVRAWEQGYILAHFGNYCESVRDLGWFSSHQSLYRNEDSKLNILVVYVYVIGWFGVVFGINSASNAVRKGVK